MKLNNKALRKIIQEACGEMSQDSEAYNDVDSLGTMIDMLDDNDDSPSLEADGGKAKMARGHLYHIANRSQSLHGRLDDNDELPEWVQSKLAVAESMVNAVYDYLDYKIHKLDHGHEESLSEINQIVREATPDKKVTNSKLAKNLKTSAADLSKISRVKDNVDWVTAIKTLANTSRFDAAKFKKLTGLIAQHGKAADEKAAKSSPEDKAEDKPGSSKFKGF